MNDFSNRQDAIDACINMCKHYTPTKSVKHPHIDFVVETLKELPSAQKKGEWIKFDEGNTVCSLCGFELDDWTQGIFYNYCPNCGADLRKRMDCFCCDGKNTMVYVQSRFNGHKRGFCTKCGSSFIE